MQNNVNTNISWYEGHNYQKFGQKIKIFKILCTKYMVSSEAMTSTHSFAYSYGLVKKCFLKICETWKCHNFLIFQPIFIRFSLFCSENFTLSSEIKLDKLRTSPLSIRSWPYFFKWPFWVHYQILNFVVLYCIVLLISYNILLLLFFILMYFIVLFLMYFSVFIFFIFLGLINFKLQSNIFQMTLTTE